MNSYLLSRRRFLTQSSLGVVGLAVSSGLSSKLFGAVASGVSIVVPTDDTIAQSIQAQWAIGQLKQAIEGMGGTVQIVASLSGVGIGDLIVVVAARSSPLAIQTGANLPTTKEAMAIVPGTLSGKAVTLASGNEARGLVYSILELVDRVLSLDSVAVALTVTKATMEESHNEVRSICRSFQSDIEDKPWFNDKAFWIEYLSMLAAERVNRFNLSFGLGYNFGNPTTKADDDYLLFVYPFLVSVAGVSVANLPATERDANLAMLKFISDECARRSIDFQLGLWCHSIVYGSASHGLQGVIGANGSVAHANYCRDALSAVLTACPNITGLTVRVHNESGIPTGNFAFWKTLFTAITPFVNAGRPLEIDMHAKECMQGHIDAAMAAKAKIVVSPKKWAEHQGLPYHQASLRISERSNSNDTSILNGQASRYGYANFFKEDRNFGVLHRLWPGSQRHLLWADPVFAAGYGRSSDFCGSLGIELYEPLSFKGREGTGTPGGRNAYSDATLTPAYDYQKFLLYYRIWGRCLYNPDTDPETWRRYYSKQFGASAGRHIEDALGNASRILMLVSTYHGASADNHVYWPEVYTNFNIVDGQPATNDSNNPLRLATSFDPQLFMNIDDYAEALLAETEFNQDKYFPIEFAQWVEDLANAAALHLASARGSVTQGNDPAFRRLDIDVSMQSKLGLFFGYKFRSAVLWSIYRKTNDANAKTSAITLYTNAKQAWIELAALGAVYKKLTYGSTSGHWSDRTVGITSDINAMNATSFTTVTGITTHSGPAALAIAKVLGRPSRPASGAAHLSPSSFTPGTALSLILNVDSASLGGKLYYRHVNQAEAWQSVVMGKVGTTFQATIPGAYTKSAYPLQYYFSVTIGANLSTLVPGFDSNLANQPYYLVRADGIVSGFNPHPEIRHQISAIANLVVIQTSHGIEVRFSLHKVTTVSGELFDINGRLMASFTAKHQSLGNKTVHLDLQGRTLARGERIIRITAEGTSISRSIN
jgi:hypothetical protein